MISCLISWVMTVRSRKFSEQSFIDGAIIFYLGVGPREALSVTSVVFIYMAISSRVRLTHLCGLIIARILHNQLVFRSCYRQIVFWSRSLRISLKIREVLLSSGLSTPMVTSGVFESLLILLFYMLLLNLLMHVLHILSGIDKGTLLFAGIAACINCWLIKVSFVGLSESERGTIATLSLLGIPLVNRCKPIFFEWNRRLICYERWKLSLFTFSVGPRRRVRVITDIVAPISWNLAIIIVCYSLIPLLQGYKCLVFRRMHRD